MYSRLTLLSLLLICLVPTYAVSDVVLIFDQSGGTGNLDELLPEYGDRVTGSPDSNGHQYDIITGAGLGLTPNVEVTYGPGIPRLWVNGYGDLMNVYYEQDSSDTELELTLVADAGFEVGLFGFDVGAFGGSFTVQGLSVVDENSNVLWSQGTTSILGTTHNDFDFAQGLFGQSLKLSVDLTGLGSSNGNIGLDNIHFAQRSTSIPEPAAATLVVLAGAGFCLKRRRRNR